MRNILSPIPFLCLLLTAQLMTACAPMTLNQLVDKTNAKKMTADEILQMAKGNTLFIHAHKLESHIYFDGSGNAYIQDIYNNKDTGSWDVSDQDELCFKLQDWWFGELRCFPVYHDGSKYYLLNSNGVLQFNADHMTGDAKNLYYSRKKSKKNFLMASERAEAADKIPPEDTKTVEKDLSDIIDRGPGPTKEELHSTVKWMAKDCPGCNLANINLSGADLIGAKLQGAVLTGANLSKANLRRAQLQEANLEKADLSYANMPGADLRDSDLTNAVFKGANLIKADLTGAKTQGADFDGALLEGVEGLTR